MRARRTAQTSLFEPRAVDHPVADDLQKASDWLDDHPELLELIEADVGGEATTGRHGLTCETILRCAGLKHLWQHSYRELEFLLRDFNERQPARWKSRSTARSPRRTSWSRHPLVDLLDEVAQKRPEQLSCRLLAEAGIRIVHASHRIRLRNEPRQRVLEQLAVLRGRPVAREHSIPLTLV